MALIECYECEREISDKSLSCPHCGAPSKKSDRIIDNKFRWLIYFLMCITPLVIFLLMPRESILFILSDSPWNGWLGSMFGAYLIIGTIFLFKIIWRIFIELINDKKQ